MVITIDHDKMNCKNANVFNCRAGRTNCSKCGFFEEQDLAVKKEEWKKVATITTSGQTHLTPVRSYYATYADIDEIKKEMEDIRRMIREMM